MDRRDFLEWLSDNGMKELFLTWEQQFPQHAQLMFHGLKRYFTGSKYIYKSPLARIDILIDENNEKWTKLKIFKYESLLCNDFEYLSSFPCLKLLSLEIRDRKDDMIGKNLHLIKSLEELDIIGGGFYLPPDFEMLTSQLKKLMVSGNILTRFVRFSWQHLEELIIGDEFESQMYPNLSETYFDWCFGMNVLKNLTIYRCKPSDTFEIAKMCPNIESIKCDRFKIETLDNSWKELLKLKQLSLINCGFKKIPVDVLKEMSIEHLSFSNQHYGSDRNNFFNTSIIFGPEFWQLKTLYILEADVVRCAIITSGSQHPFELIEINVTTNAFEHGDDYWEDSNDKTNLQIVDPAGLIRNLEVIFCDGPKFCYAALYQRGLRAYGGGLRILSMNPDNIIDFDQYVIATLNRPVRARLYDILAQRNPTFRFHSTEFGDRPMTPEEMARRARVRAQANGTRTAPYFCIYDQTMPDVHDNPFAPDATCRICLDGFLQDEQQPTSDTGNAFLNNINDLPENRTVVFCNFVDSDHISKMADHYHHFSHLSCLQKWLRTNKTCPVNRDVFKNDIPATTQTN
jgi:hypothetical protein